MAHEGDTLAIPPLTIAPELAPLLDLGLLTAGGLAVGPSGPEIARAIAAVAEAHRTRHADQAIGNVPGIGPVRRLMSALGTDPTKNRPSSEALLRRVLKGQGLHAVNNVVDTVNLCSLRWLLPMGLYDHSALHGPLLLRRGAPGDGYPGIGKERVNLENRPALFDDGEPFGAPTSDSFRTRVHEGTTRIFLVIYAPRGAGVADLLPRCLADTRQALVDLCGAVPGEERVLDG